MAKDTDNELGFAALDPLLDQALDLDGEALEAFLAALPDRQRDALKKLLANSQGMSLRDAGAAAQSVVRGLDQSGGSGARAGEWQLKREIGAGGTGQVFYAERHERKVDDGEADDDTFVQRAAVKVLWSHRIRSQFRERFLRERRILASIDHPGLARFLDGGLLGDGRPWFAMEYVDGDNIVNVTASQPVKERLKSFVDIADTINFAHQRLVVHRDIKPQNILVDSFNRPRVLDFGIAGVLGEYDPESLTQAQGTPLTLQYASPEQVTGGSVDVASDVYQLGLLMYEMLTGRTPYSVGDESLQIAVRTICNDRPAPPSTYNSELGHDLDAIAEKALRKDPAKRYASAAAMADDVRRFLSGHPVEARPQSQWYTFSRFLRRNALVASVVAGSVVALAFATVFSINRAQEARADAERSRATQRILADVFEQADPFGDGGAELTLAEALVRAKPGIAKTVAHDPRLAWEVNRTLAGIFTNLDLIDLEEEALQAAWVAARDLDGDNERERLFAVAGLGNILVRKDPTAGIEFLAEQLPESPSTERGAVEWLSAKYAEVSAHLRLRNDEQADRGARAMDAVARRFNIDTPRTLSRIEQLLAGAARRADDLAAADEHWSRAIAHMRNADAPLGLAVMLSNRALHYGMTDRFPASAAAFQESIEIFENHETDNSSHANVLRLYAGLLFRMRKADEAQAALDDALSILDPAEQSYAYFIAQLNRANFAFAVGDTATTYAAIEQGLDVAIRAFGHDADVTRRMLPVFARLLLFVDREFDAADLVVTGQPSLCADRRALVDAVDAAVVPLANNPATESARLALQETVQSLGQSVAEGPFASARLVDAMATYRNSPDVFLDALDRYRFIAAISDIDELAADTNVDVRAELERLQALRAQTEASLANQPRLRGLIDALSSGFSESCKKT